MGYHHTNRAYVDAKAEIERPEILLYERRADGSYALNGVEYIIPYRVWPRDSVPPRVMDRAMLRNDELSLWYLHMWAWTTNAAGLFADWNPSVQCRGGASGAASPDYPHGYREWAHVKSALVSPAHASYATNGGFQHIYANSAALRGYRTRSFPEGSVIAFDWLAMRDNASVFAEDKRRQLDVMIRDSLRFAATGGWGFVRFAGDSRTERASAPTSQQCFACHDARKQDGLVLSTYRP
jgi:hypothetical protein